MFKDIAANKRRGRFLKHHHRPVVAIIANQNSMTSLTQYNLRKFTRVWYHPITAVAVVKLLFSKTSVFTVTGLNMRKPDDQCLDFEEVQILKI